jgi:hypothetical protein
MTLPKAHLVYGGSPKHLVRYEDHLIYSRRAEPTNLIYYGKRGQDGSSNFAAAYAALQSAAWVENQSDQASVARVDPNYTLDATCYRFDMQDEGSDWEGETLLKFRVDVQDLFGSGLTWRIGFQQNNTGVPDDAWAWLTGAPAATGVGLGLVDLDPNPPVAGIVLQRYVFLILSFETYADPASSPTSHVLNFNYFYFVF